MSDYDSLQARLDNEYLQSRLERESGLGASAACTDAENSARVRFILSAFECGLPLQRTLRASGTWQDVEDLPLDFENYMYRTAR